jgi:L-fuculose-phosphate aldolase
VDTLTLRAAKDAIIEVGRRMWAQGFVAANDGNLSVRVSEDRILATATGSIKGFLTEADLVIIDRNGAVVEGSRRVTSEIQMHLAIYDARSDVRAVAHAHPPTATGFATAGVPLDLCVLPEIVATLGTIPTVPYATPSTRELPAALVPHLRDGHACLLANHGAVAWDADLFSAYYHLERMEHFAKILLTARLLGNVQVMSEDQVSRLAAAVGYGTDPGGPQCRVLGATGDGAGTSALPEATPGAGTTREARGWEGGLSPSSTPPARSWTNPAEDEDLIESIVREVHRILTDGG